MKTTSLTVLFGISLLAATGSALSGDGCVFFARPDIEPAPPVRHTLKLHQPLHDARLHPRRGTVVVRITPQRACGGYPTVLSVFPGPPHANIRLTFADPDAKSAAEPGTLVCAFNVTLDHRPDGNTIEDVKGTAAVKAGEPVHAAWTWSGLRHDLYLNGERVARTLAHSPFPPAIEPPVRLLHNYPADLLDAAPVSEIAGYAFAMTPEQVRADRSGDDGEPFAPASPQPPLLTAQWAPGERKVHAALDTGGAFAEPPTVAALQVERDGQRAASFRLPVAGDGFGEAVYDLEAMPPGTYRLVATFGGAAAESEAWTLPATPWLRNERGRTDEVQPPWTPVERDGDALLVWGRRYELGGGFGLPRQIVSQRQRLLAEPVRLELVSAGGSTILGGGSVEIDAVTPGHATWTGRAEGGGVAATVRGRLEVDGMMLLTLRLAPTAGPVALDGIRLQTTMPKEQALFLNTSTDQGYWWYPYKGWVPETPGVVHDNLRQKAAATRFLFFVLLGNDTAGLEWFADNLSGWHVDERQPVQEIVREEDGDVRLQCLLANRPFELDEPVEITFGYDATPVKPLPEDWRTAYVHYTRLPGFESDLAMWWLWTDHRFNDSRPGIFSLRPDDLEAFTETRKRLFGVKLAPFVNQHVTVPAYPDNRRENGGWPWFHNLLRAESGNDGWTAVPTRGIRDYWAWNLDPWLAADGLDAIYIDEANTRTVSAGLLTGSGYRRPDGTHAHGHNTLAMREQLKRVRQLFIDHGKRPLVWLPTYTKTIPHVHAFADVVSEGESFMFEDPAGPDFIDRWGAGLLERGGQGGGAWLRSLGMAQKFGQIPIFLDYIKFYNHPAYLRHQRAMTGLLALHDIIPISPVVGWVFKAKADFGLPESETAFHPYFEQEALRATREDVAVSYYRRGDRLLVVAVNLGQEPFEGVLRADGFSVSSAVRLGAEHEPVYDAERRQWRGLRDTAVKRTDVPLRDGAVPLTLSPHDVALLELPIAGP